MPPKGRGKVKKVTANTVGSTSAHAAAAPTPKSTEQQPTITQQTTNKHNKQHDHTPPDDDDDTILPPSTSTSRASSPVPFPSVTTVSNGDGHSAEEEPEADDEEPIHIKLESFRAQEGQDSDEESDSESDREEKKAKAQAAAAQAANPYISSRAPRSAADMPIPIGKSPAPSPSPESAMNVPIETEKEVRDLAYAAEWKDRLTIEPSAIRSTFPPTPMEVDKVDQVTDRSSFHTMMDTYFRPIDYIDLLKIGQLKVLLAPMPSSSSAPREATSAATSSSTATASSTSTAPAAASSSATAASSSLAGLAGSSPSATSHSTSSHTSPLSGSTAASSTSTTTSSSGHTSAAPSSSSGSYSTAPASSSSSSSGVCTCHHHSSSSRYSSYSSSHGSNSYASSSSSSYPGTSSASTTSNNLSGYTLTNSSGPYTSSSITSSSNYTSNSSSSYSSSASSSNFSSTANMYAAAAAGGGLPYPYNIGAITTGALYPQMYGYNTNSYAASSSNTSGSGSSGTYHSTSSASMGSSSSYSSGSSSNQSRSYSGSSGSGSHGSSSSYCPVHGSVSSGHSTRSSGGSSYSTPRVHSSQFVTVLQQLRGPTSTNSLAHLPNYCLPPSYMMPHAPWDPSFILPPLGKTSTLAKLQAESPVTPPAEPLTRASSATMVDVTSSSPASIGGVPAVPRLPQFQEFPHLALMLGLPVHPDLVCIPHTQALMVSTASQSTFNPSSIPGTSSWAPPPKPPPTPLARSLSQLSNSTAPASAYVTPSPPPPPVSSTMPHPTSSSSSSSSTQLTLSGHPHLSPTKDSSVPVLFTMYASSSSASETSRSTQSTDTKQLEADAAMTQYAGLSKEPVSILVDYLASGLSASVASLADKMSSLAAMSNTVHPRMHLQSFLEIEASNLPPGVSMGYSVEDRQVEKYRREFKEREAQAIEAAAQAAAAHAAGGAAASEKKTGEESKSNATTPMVIDTKPSSAVPAPVPTPSPPPPATPTRARPEAKSMRGKKAADASMPPLESPSKATAAATSSKDAAASNAFATLPATLLQHLVEYVMLEAHHAAAARLKANAAAEKADAKAAAAAAAVSPTGDPRVKLETDEDVDTEVDTSRLAAISYSANLPHSLIPEVMLQDLPPLPPLPPALAADQVLHELLQLQYYLALQNESNLGTATALRRRCMLQHQSLYIEKRVQWIKTIHETYASANLWQGLRLQLQKGVRDVPIPPALMKNYPVKQVKDEANSHHHLNEPSTNLPWTIKSDSYNSKGSLSKQLTHSTHSSSHVHLDDSKLLVRSKSAPVESEWTHKTDEQIEAELADASLDSEDYSVCAVCFDGSSIDDNPILFCDRCNVSVHQKCYGLKTIPDTEGWLWVCDWCTQWKEKLKANKQREKERERAKAKAMQLAAMLPPPASTPTPGSGSSTPIPPVGLLQSSASSSNLLGLAENKKSTSGRPPRSGQTPTPDLTMTSNSVTPPATSSAPNPYICALCPCSGGAVKPASDVFDADGSPLWVHLACAIWIPKVRIMNTKNMAPVSVAPALKLQRDHYHRVCTICKLSYGACVPCSHDECGAYFHPLCAWYEGLAMSIDVIEIDCRFLIYCLKHTPKSLVENLQMYDGSSSHQDMSDEGQLVSASHLSFYDRTILRARQQRDIRQRGRAHHSEKTREKRRKKQFLERRRKERARAMREDLYEPGRCAVCFLTDAECVQARAFEDVRKRELAVTKAPNAANQPYFLVNGLAPTASVKNRLLRCEECDVEVHQNCFGVTDAEYDEVQKRVQAERHNVFVHSSTSGGGQATTDAGGWVCRRCAMSTSSDRDVSCALCPRKGGAFKKTVTGRWAHVVCAVWIPEAGFADPVLLEPIEGLTELTKLRKRQMCYLCQRPGPCIQCCEDGCSNTFHPTCGLFSGAYMGLLESIPPQINNGPTTITIPMTGEVTTIPLVQPPPLTHYKIYCRKHTPLPLSKFLPIPLAYIKLYKLRLAYDHCKAGVEKLKTYDKKKLSELKEECDYEELVWRESRMEAETGVKSKKLKPPKQPRGRKGMGTMGNQSSSTSSYSGPTSSSMHSPNNSAGMASPMRTGTGSTGRGKNKHANNNSGMGSGSNGSPSGSGSGNSGMGGGSGVGNSPMSSGINMNAVNSMLTGLPFGPGSGFMDGGSNSSFNNSLSNAMSSSLGFPFGALPNSNMAGMSLPMNLGGASMPLSGMNSSTPIDMQPIIEMASQQQANRNANKQQRGGRKANTQQKDMNDQQPLQMWLQALESTNSVGPLAAAAGITNSAAAAYNAVGNPFNAFSSNSLAQYNLSAFYQQLAAASNLPGLLGGTGNNNSLNNSLSSSLANAFTNSLTNQLTQSLAASLTNSLGGISFNAAVGLMGLLPPSTATTAAANAASLMQFLPMANGGLNSFAPLPTGGLPALSSATGSSSSLSLMSSATSTNINTTPSTTTSISSPILPIKRKAEEDETNDETQAAKRQKTEEQNTVSNTDGTKDEATPMTDATGPPLSPASLRRSVKGSTHSPTLTGAKKPLAGAKRKADDDGPEEETDEAKKGRTAKKAKEE